MLTGQASNAAKARRSAQGELTPTPHTGPNSWPMTVVTPEARDASRTRGDNRCTWVSMAPGVGDEPLAADHGCAGADDDVDAVEGVRVAGAAHALTRPPRMPMDTLRTPAYGSMSTTLETTTSQVSRTLAALRAIPSRAVLPKPMRKLVAGVLESCST